MDVRVENSRDRRHHVRPHETLAGARPIERYLADPDDTPPDDVNTTAPTRQKGSPLDLGVNLGVGPRSPARRPRSRFAARWPATGAPTVRRSDSPEALWSRRCGRPVGADGPANRAVPRPRNPDRCDSEAQPIGQGWSVRAERSEPRSGALEGSAERSYSASARPTTTCASSNASRAAKNPPLCRGSTGRASPRHPQLDRSALCPNAHHRREATRVSLFALPPARLTT